MPKKMTDDDYQVLGYLKYLADMFGDEYVGTGAAKIYENLATRIAGEERERAVPDVAPLLNELKACGWVEHEGTLWKITDAGVDALNGYDPDPLAAWEN